jgi:hypothetical protein
MLFELRQYRTRPGQRDNWVRFFEAEIVPFQTAQGMVIVGSWIVENDPDAFVWIRRFASEEDRVRLYAAVYESDHWKTNIAPHTGQMLIREEIKVTRMEPTPGSASR